MIINENNLGSPIAKKSDSKSKKRKISRHKYKITFFTIIISVILSLFMVVNRLDNPVKNNSVSNSTEILNLSKNQPSAVGKSYSIINPPNEVVFNSFIDSSNEYLTGDEQQFCFIRMEGQKSWQKEMIIEPGQKYEIMNYYHNNSKSNESENTQMKGTIPYNLMSGMTGIISSEIRYGTKNTSSISDSIKLTSSSELSIMYIPDSLTIHNKGKTDGQILDSLDFFTIGTKLGENSLNGKISNLSYGVVTYNIETSAPESDIVLKVRKEESSEWQNKVYDADESVIDCQIEFKNTGSTQLNDVVISVALPDGIEKINNSVLLYDSSTTEPVNITDSIFYGGVNIGGYLPNGNCFIKFKVKATGDMGDVLKITASSTTLHDDKTTNVPVIISDAFN